MKKDEINLTGGVPKTKKELKSETPPGFLEAANSKNLELYKEAQIAEECKDGTITKIELDLALKEFSDRMIKEWNALIESEPFVNFRLAVDSLVKAALEISKAAEKIDKKK